MLEQERLYINDKLVELGVETVQFTRTLQVNDLVSLDNRQTNFTKNIKIPRTPNNVFNLDYLGVIGNNSNLPYQRNTVKYFVGNEAIIYNGWGVINETNDYYNLTVYDGNIDLYKSIENKTLSDLNLSGLTHSKTLTTVLNSFTATTLPYKYILADYNGKATYTSTSGATTATTINIDYLVPSVKVGYLWDNIFTQYGYTYDGSIFSNPDFTNLWLTYPKGTPADLGSTVIYSGGTLTANSGLTKTNSTTFTATENISLNIKLVYTFSFQREQPSDYVAAEIYMQVNNSTVKYLATIDNPDSGTFSFNTIFNVGDVFTFYYSFVGVPATYSFTLDVNQITKYNSLSIAFGDDLIGFSTKDFINEIIQRFGLSIFKNKYTNNYSFRTLSEITTNSTPVDWSSKYQSLESEKYIYGSYNQKNLMQYKYNDDNANYNDGAILVDNKNLDDSKVIIQSKIYSPELTLSNELGFPSKVYKLWNKEVKDDGTITYKTLENRFHFLRSVEKSFTSTTTIGSKSQVTNQTITAAPVESFSRLSFNDIVTNYYPDISRVLNKSKILIANINLNYVDISNFDFTKLYFIKQLGNYYLVNKIVNFQMGKTTKVEMIKVAQLSTGVSGAAQYKTVIVKPNKSYSSYRFDIDIDLPSGFTTFNGSGSYIKFNGGTTGFISFTNVSGNTYRLSSLSNSSTAGEMQLEYMNIIFTDNNTTITYSVFDTPLSFTPAEVTGGTPKNLSLKIT
jgi:hypothetical protein